MGKLNLIMLLVVFYCGLLVVEFEHKSRTLFVELGRAQDAERQLEVAFTRLQLRQVELSKGDRIDQIAREKLRMQLPEPDKTVFMTLSGRPVDE